MRFSVKKISAKTAVNLLLLSLWIGVAGWLTVWLGDDIHYMYCVNHEIWDSWGVIESPYALFSSMYFHYLGVNGRYIAHLLVQLFCGILGQKAFAVVNAIVWPIFVMLILKLARIDRPAPKAVCGTVALCLLGFATKMMPTCQIGFIWMFTLIMAFLLVLRHWHAKRARWWQLVLMAALAILAGNAQEALGIGVAGALGILALRRRFRLSAVEWTMIAGFYVGLGFLCFSPAVGSRVESVSVGLWDSIANMVISLRIFWAMLAVAIYALAKKRVTCRRIWDDSWFWLTVMAVLVAMNLVIGVYCNRQLFGIELCSMIILLRILTLGHRQFSPAWLVILNATAIAMMSFQMVWIIDSREQFREIERLYLESKNGIIYTDRHQSSTSVQALTGRYNENVIGLHYNDLAHSMLKYFRHQYSKKEKKNLLIYPSAVNEWGRKPLQRRIAEEYEPGHWLVAKDTTDAGLIVIDYDYNLPGTRLHAYTDTLEGGRDHTPSRPYATYIIVAESPLYKVSNAKIVDKR